METAARVAPERAVQRSSAHPQAPRWHIPALMAGVAALALWRLNSGIDLGDEGFMAHCAARVMEGQVPHRDFYSLQGPLSSMILAGWSKVVGLSFLKLRVLGALIHGGMVLLTYLIARRVSDPRWALAAGAASIIIGLPHMRFAPLAVWQGLALSMLTVWLALRSVQDGNRKLAFASGITASLSLLVRHDQGAYMVLSILVLAAATRWVGRARFNLLAWIAGALCVGLPAFLIAWATGALSGMWEQLVLFPLTRYGGTSSIPFPSLDQAGPAGSPLAFLFFRLTPLVALAALPLIAWRLIRGFRGMPEAIGLFLSAWSLLMFGQVMVRSDLAHLVLTMHPLLVLVAWLAHYLRHALDWSSRWPSVASGAGALGFAVITALSIRMFLPPWERDATRIESRFASVVDEDGAEINAVIKAIESDSGPDDAVLVLPYHPAYYVLADRRNPTRWGYHWPGDRTDEELKELIAQAEVDRPRAVVIFDRDSTATFLGPVVQWVEAHYSAIDTHADPVIYRQRNEVSLP